MRAKSASELGIGDLRRAIDRLDALPLRPASARQALAGLPDDEGEEVDREPPGPIRPPALAETDPAWALVGGRDPLSTLAAHRWWPSAAGPVAEALDRLWRHSAAVALAARRLAREAGDPDPDALARAGLLADLGPWALAAVAPDRLVALLGAPDLESRRALERHWLGAELSSLGRDLAARWACEPLIVESAWLHADLDADLSACSAQPERLALIHRAFALAERTPWALDPAPVRDVDARVRLLTAEVQSRCVGPFADVEASPREERLTREVARLRLDNARLRVDRDALDRLARFVAGSTPTETPEAWADRAALAWCGAPGVVAARVDWADPGDEFPASTIIPLGEADRPLAQVRLRLDPTAPPPSPSPDHLGAWNALALGVAERSRLARLLDEAVSAHRGRVAREEPTRRKALLEALAEFAAGAGHELNNPLAVIAGRAQLLLAREDDPDSARSLRTVIAQAQRAHRLLRDLMGFARPPEPRPRACQPFEIVRACLRDLQGEAEARGVRIVADPSGPVSAAWLDPEPLRLVADILARNALEATPSGGVVRFTASGDPNHLRWTVHDSGRGLDAHEASHLFDPFFCGRQAGRGLGLGLSRASRIVARAGGDLRWHSTPGQGSSFQVTIPLPTIPDPDRPLPID